jgi:hypothetical protein
MGRRKRERARISKEARKNLRLWAEGEWESILKPHLEEYAQALDKGWHNECRYLKKVCNEFHARVDWRLADHEEPELKDYDPKAVILPETLEDAEEVAKRQRIKQLNAVSHISHIVLHHASPLLSSAFADGSTIASARHGNTTTLLDSIPLKTLTPSFLPSSLVSSFHQKQDKHISSLCTSRMWRRLHLSWPRDGQRN